MAIEAALAAHRFGLGACQADLATAKHIRIRSCVAHSFPINSWSEWSGRAAPVLDQGSRAVFATEVPSVKLGTLFIALTLQGPARYECLDTPNEEA